MARYLLVLHTLDGSPGLVAAALHLASRDTAAEFVLLTPSAVAPFDLLLEPQCSAIRLAARRARRMRDQLLAAGIDLLASRMGNFDPFHALEDALRFSDYAAVVIAAPEHKLLHLIHCDLTCRLARRFRGAHLIHASKYSQQRAMRVDHEPRSLTTSGQN